ncbi:hypothetical protein [Lentibacillus sp. CBA3610]|uniref:hypothetical protein n=1 Tax=Lentibacillus sp. CBA3610 TaxID=2518176 RepID=UPI001595C55F|nr:hypothetical protein [Lentibacillus sp. CBA3610]
MIAGAEKEAKISGPSEIVPSVSLNTIPKIKSKKPVKKMMLPSRESFPIVPSPQNP